MRTAPLAVIAVLALLIAAPLWATPLLPDGLTGASLSHLVPHLLPESTSDACPPGMRPLPLEWQQPLRGENEGVCKGFEPANEELLARALLALPLRQRVLKVAVANAFDKRMALVKLQAGDMQSGLFRLDDLQQDAISALQVAFRLPLGLDEVDLWSVIPGQGPEGPTHQPVFSLSADRSQFELPALFPRTARDLLGDLGLIRFDPRLLSYSGHPSLEEAASALPSTAFSVEPLSETWGQLITAAQQDPRLGSASVARVVSRIPVGDNSVALTIDDGPHPLITSLFLETLRQYRVKATFFVVGEKVEECPELLRRMVEAGHEIGNHTYSHPRLRNVSDTEALAQFRACALAVGRVSGTRMHLARPPGGGLASHVLRAATAANCTVVMWTHNTNDWLKPSVQEIVDNALRDLRPGDIILMHQGDLNSAQALPLIIEGARAKGLELSTVGEMLAQCPAPAVPIPDLMARYDKNQLEDY